MSIKKICIFDFDQTLCASPENTPENRKLWESKTGREWLHKGQGWWSKDESLDYNVFDISLNEDILDAAKSAIGDPEVYTVLLTGRIPKFSSKIKEIMRRGGLDYMDAYYFNDSHNTLNFKLSKMEFLKKEFPEAEFMEMWEDRVEHITHFIAWGEENYGSNFKMNIVKI